MGNFIVSARKYRPATFDQVVGQRAITDTLKNAILSDHLGQAFLFCGPRGVGKTSCARILAKVMNCQNLQENAEPCNNCDSCKSFNEGGSLNIYELDAASNNSVDDIRNLVEQVRYAPHEGQYKIYIIDEVHMLSTSAFNAFLKTLEEPPSYAIFILATTEKHKILPTILSRCQIYDFNRIAINDIVEHLSNISEKENINADKQGLHFIAQKADGALRDALSIFDQLTASAENELSYESVVKNLNILDYEYYFKVTDALREGDFNSVLLQFNEILLKGFEGQQFINGLSQHFRDLLVSKDPQTLALLEVSDEIRNRYSEQAQSLSIKELIQWLQICNACDVSYKSAKNHRLHVEIALIKIAGMQNQIADPELAEAVAQKKNPSLKKEPATAGNIKASSEETTTQVKEDKLPEHAAQKSSPETEVEVQEATKPAVANQAAAEINQDAVKSEENKIRRPATISIKDRLNPKSGQPAIRRLRDSDFSEDNFQDAYQAFCQQVSAQKRKNLYYALTNKPVTIKGKELKLHVENKVQLKEVEKSKIEMQDFIAEKLHNDKLSILLILDEVKEEDVKPYTNAEKFREMAKRNPDLLELKKKLDLDFD